MLLNEGPAYILSSNLDQAEETRSNLACDAPGKLPVFERLPATVPFEVVSGTRRAVRGGQGSGGQLLLPARVGQPRRRLALSRRQGGRPQHPGLRRLLARRRGQVTAPAICNTTTDFAGSSTANPPPVILAASNGAGFTAVG